MQNMWSENKILNNLINILIFLLAINFLHYGQLFLPAICLLIFIANHFKFKVKSLLTFIVLCLFAISFFVFSYDYGFYSVMGFCLPMAYYIGSNIRPNDDNVKKLIYLIAFGMACHVILNFIYDNYYHLKTENVTAFFKYHHYDVWILDVATTTGVATNYPMAIGCIFYLLTYENNKKYKYIGIIAFALIAIYEIALGRRTPLFIFLISFFIVCLIDRIINKKSLRTIFIASACILLFSIAIVIIYHYDLFGLKWKLHSIRIIQKFAEYGLSSGRLDLFVNAIKLMPYHLWGGQEISSILGEQIHDLWCDVYDFAGIVTFIFLVIYTTIQLCSLIKVINTKIKNKIKAILLYIDVIICCLLQLALEPIMTGASLFMICVVIVFAAIGSLTE